MKIKVLFITFFAFACTYIYAQENKTQIFIASWNVENLFNTVNDTMTFDEEFLPTSEKEWTSERLQKKFESLAKVITSMNNGEGPDVLAVQEVERKELLDTLTTYLKNNYKVVYAESPDERGIDCGILYNSDKLKLISHNADTVNLEQDEKTRLVLGAVLLTKTNEHIFVFSNHFPSRRGGEQESDKYRVKAASVLRNNVDRILTSNPNANIVIMGDFNDEPANNSLNKTLKAINFSCDSLFNLDNKNLYNTSYPKFLSGEGTYFFQEDFNMLDNIILSKNLLVNSYKCNSFEVYKPEFMVTKSGKFKGAPHPTYGGKRYLGGYSDHFPVTAVLEF